MESSLYRAFADLEDPRQAHKVKHSLQDIIVLAIVAVMSNAQSWTQIEAFGQAKEAWLKQWMVLENGIPAHATIQRVFQALSAEALMTKIATEESNYLRVGHQSEHIKDWFHRTQRPIIDEIEQDNQIPGV